MRIRAGFTITLRCPAPTPFIFLLNVHPSREPDLVTPDRIARSRPNCPSKTYRDGFGNRCLRLLAPQGDSRSTAIFSSTTAVCADEVALDGAPA